MADQLTEAGNLIPAALGDRITAIEKVVSESGLAALHHLGAFQRTFVLAKGMARMRELLTPEMMKDVMALQGSPLGFCTDKDRNRDGSKGPGYPPEIVRDVTIEALMSGLRMVNNEVNIISGRMYAAKNGCERLVREFPGLTDYKPMIGLPRSVEGKGAVVTVSATWKLNGKPDDYAQREIAIKVNEFMGADAIVGKATRKLAAQVYKQVSGASVAEGEAGEDDALASARDITPEKPEGPKPESRAEEINQKLAGQDAAAPKAEPEKKPEPPKNDAGGGDLWG